jgi:hypothetical protein
MQHIKWRAAPRLAPGCPCRCHCPGRCPGLGRRHRARRAPELYERFLTDARGYSELPASSADRVNLARKGADIGSRRPPEGYGRVGSRELAPGDLAQKDKGDDAARHVLADASQLLRLDVETPFFANLAAKAIFDGFVELKDAARSFPVAVVAVHHQPRRLHRPGQPHADSRRHKAGRASRTTCEPVAATQGTSRPFGASDPTLLTPPRVSWRATNCA